jgi:hypothetical protein
LLEKHWPRTRLSVGVRSYRCEGARVGAEEGGRGMNWRLTIDIKKYLTEGNCTIGQVNADCAKAILQELQPYSLSILDNPRFLADAQEVVDELESVMEQLSYLAWLGDECEQDAVNDALDRLYDWGDAYRIWLGL